MTISLYRSYSTTMLLTPGYSLGFCISMCLVTQLVTGLLLSTGYTATAASAFDTVHVQIMRDLDSGWLLRSCHANGASMFMLCIYLHMYRCLWHGSASKSVVWLIGVIMYILVCGACFTGYSLVYGQMSLWAIVVICSLVTAVPVIGHDLLHLIWGDNVVSSVTIQRIYTLHFLLPLIITALAAGHLLALHSINSSGEFATVLTRRDRINFHPILFIRDAAVVSILGIIYSYYVFMDQDALGHPDNYVPANALVTPAEIAPEWYFLPFYSIIRAIPHKALGIVMMVLMLVSLTSLTGISTHQSKHLITPIRYWSTSGLIAPSSTWSRSMLMLLVLDTYMASILCLKVNHSESMYWLLLATVLGMMGSELTKSAQVSTRA